LRTGISHRLINVAAAADAAVFLLLQSRKLSAQDSQVARDLSLAVQSVVETRLAAHYSRQAANDRIFQNDFDFNRDWQHFEARTGLGPIICCPACHDGFLSV